jgi:hypothetical protein
MDLYNAEKVMTPSPSPIDYDHRLEGTQRGLPVCESAVTDSLGEGPIMQNEICYPDRQHLVCIRYRESHEI